MKKILTRIALVLNSLVIAYILVDLAGMMLVGIPAAREAIGIIGSNDGPTALFLQAPVESRLFSQTLLLGILIFYEVVFIMNLKKRNEK